LLELTSNREPVIPLPALPELHSTESAPASSAAPAAQASYIAASIGEVAGIPKLEPTPAPHSQPAEVPSVADAVDQSVAPRDPEVALAASQPTDSGRAVPNSQLEQRMRVPELGAKPRQDPESTWRAGMEVLLELAHLQADAEAKRGMQGVWLAREKVLDRLMLSDGTRWQLLMQSLDAAMVETGPNDASVKADLVDEAEAPVLKMDLPDKEPASSPASELRVSELQLCRKVDGFGSYETLDCGSLRVNQRVGLYWELEGLAWTAQEQQHKARMSTRLEILAEGSPEPVWQGDLGESEDTCRRPRRDFFVNTRWAVPETLKPGTYRLRVVVNDRVAGQEAIRETSFEVTE
jgi:hypothetical protein